ncbi:MAG TPA: TlpA disulfide reductase family protein [Hanamia sp.]|nr:TlpA disulfide reductase family protein [Hanamia sp.]
MKVIYCLMIFLWPLVSSGQKIKPMAIGDKVPDVCFENLFNYNNASVQLSTLGNKLVLLDFMTTGCVSCIRALPRLDSLQRKYKDGLQVFLVTPESAESVKNFLKRKYMAGMELPVMAADTTLSQLFPHTYISHEVLIKNQKVLAITYPEYIVEKNVKAIIQNLQVNLPIKRDITAFQYDQPFLHINELVVPALSYPTSISYSAVTAYMDNVPSRYKEVKDSLRKVISISMINLPLIDLYRKAFSVPHLAPAFILLSTHNRERFIYSKQLGYYKEWLQKNTFCYQGVFPMNRPSSSIQKKIISDLDFYLGLHATLKSDTVNCWVIKKLPGKTTVNKKPVNGDPESNASIDDILFFLNKDFGNTPVINESVKTKDE